MGLLDRKMRVVMENTETEDAWHKWTTIAFQSVYGFDWQGDNVLLARENLLLSYIDYYKARFEKEPEIDSLRKIAEILIENRVLRRIFQKQTRKKAETAEHPPDRQPIVRTNQNPANPGKSRQASKISAEKTDACLF